MVTKGLFTPKQYLPLIIQDLLDFLYNMAVIGPAIDHVSPMY